MSSFTPTEERLATTVRRHPAFPLQPAKAVRLIKHLYRRLQDETNAVLKPWGINHPEYNLLIMLYGTESFALNPTQLAEAAGEKLANITRLTNELHTKGLIERAAAADDRRKITLKLSDKGLKLLESCLPKLCELLQRQSEGMSEGELTKLEHLLKRFLHNMDAE